MAKLSGFILIEIFISILLVTSISISFGTWYIYTLESYQTALNRIKALNIAASLLEQVRGYNSIPDSKSYPPFNIEWSSYSTSINRFSIVTVKVLWQEKNNKHNVTLTTGALIK